MLQENNNLDLRRFWRAARQWKWLLIAGTVLLTALCSWYGVTRRP